jgi:hypothetical protein
MKKSLKTIMICENYFFKVIDFTDDSFQTERINCPNEATKVTFDDFHGRDVEVCASCCNIIEITKYIHSPAGRAELERQDPWNDEQA